MRNAKATFEAAFGCDPITMNKLSAVIEELQ
ncbi:hypothetical protein ACIQ57_16970 [Lysinibacillus xylanilyticus]